MVSPALCMKGEKREREEEVDDGEVFKRWFGLFYFSPHKCRNTYTLLYK